VNLFFGADEGELEKENKKKYKNAHPDFGKL
jgi:hypothetical protein